MKLFGIRDWVIYRKPNSLNTVSEMLLIFDKEPREDCLQGKPKFASLDLKKELKTIPRKVRDIAGVEAEDDGAVMIAIDIYSHFVIVEYSQVPNPKIFLLL